MEVSVFESTLYLIVAVIALFPLFAFYVTYKRTKDQRVVFTFLAFLLLFIKGILAVLGIFFESLSEIPSPIFDLGLIVLITWGMYGKSKESDLGQRVDAIESEE